MGQQSNKVQKKRRRLAYIDRLRTKAKEAAAARGTKKKAAPKKEAVAAAE